MSIRPDQISQASVDAAAEVLWNENGYITMEEARDMARAVLAAALAAWPGMYAYPGTKICLPLETSE